MRIFFDFLSNISHFNKFFVPIISKFVDFLCHFCLEQTDISIVSSNRLLLQKIHNLYPNIKKFEVIWELLSSQKSTLVHLNTSLFSKSEIEQCSQSIKINRNHFELNQAKSVVIALSDLELVSNQTPTILSYFPSEIADLLLWSADLHHDIGPKLRTMGYTLCLRLINYSPRDAPLIVGSYLEALDSKHTDVRTTALEYALEFYHFATDQTKFLMKLFSSRVAKETSLSTLIKIIECALKFRCK